MAEGFPSVAKAQVLDVNDCKKVHYYQVNVAVAPDGGGKLSSLLKQDLTEYLVRMYTPTPDVDIRAGQIAALVDIRWEGHNEEPFHKVLGMKRCSVSSSRRSEWNWNG